MATAHQRLTVRMHTRRQAMGSRWPCTDACHVRRRFPDSRRARRTSWTMHAERHLAPAPAARSALGTPNTRPVCSICTGAAPRPPAPWTRLGCGWAACAGWPASREHTRMCKSQRMCALILRASSVRALLTSGRRCQLTLVHAYADPRCAESRACHAYLLQTSACQSSVSSNGIPNGRLQVGWKRPWPRLPTAS